MTSYILGRIVVSEPDTPTGVECRACGFDAVLRFPLHVLTSEGVSRFGDYVTCVRCDDTKDEA